MKKNLIVLVLLFLGTLLFSQVGINTENPQQLFHTDGKSSVTTINPITGSPNLIQQADDVVITNQGRIGIGTTTPSEKLEVNGKTKINDLPVNGTNGFTATKTLVASDNGIVGVLNGLPSGAYDGYSLTAMEEFVESKSTPRNYNYNQIVGDCNDPVFVNLCTPVIYSVLPVYSTTFNKSSSNKNKYISLFIDYQLTTTSIAKTTYLKGHWYNYEIEIIINGKSIKQFNSKVNIAANSGGGDIYNKVFTINLSNLTLNPTNNKLDIKLIPGINIIRTNSGTANGNYETGRAHLMTTEIKDISFFLYEK